ncbi:hypothetical protein [Actibacterium sp. 188UL27-1]|uniref:hypothetical protein n=1 Tax=Actibacterium sp. 188UL27-1 TaxID=2786961 RepID=UPI00195ECC0E|nr:hypothetical protein [Actibacterium sp. 188UL27-1]MBM7066885.1 hypothetical protein [Actibacterium sp. 188UL27-1]
MTDKDFPHIEDGQVQTISGATAAIVTFIAAGTAWTSAYVIFISGPGRAWIYDLLRRPWGARIYRRYA